MVEPGGFQCAGDWPYFSLPTVSMWQHHIKLLWGWHNGKTSVWKICFWHSTGRLVCSFLSQYLWMFSFVCFLYIGLYGQVSVCVCVRVCVSWYACVSDLEGFYGTSVTLAASAQHHSEWALVGRYVGGKYTETYFYRTECDPNKGLESSLEQQQHQYIVSTLSLN